MNGGVGPGHERKAVNYSLDDATTTEASALARRNDVVACNNCTIFVSRTPPNGFTARNDYAWRMKNKFLPLGAGTYLWDVYEEDSSALAEISEILFSSLLCALWNVCYGSWKIIGFEFFILYTCVCLKLLHHGIAVFSYQNSEII